MFFVLRQPRSGLQEYLMPRKPSIALARKQRIPALALAALRMPVAFEIGGNLQITAAMLNAVRMNGRIVIGSSLDFASYNVAFFEANEKFQAYLNAYARFSGELRIENVRPIRPPGLNMDYTVFELVCTSHPDAPPGWAPSTPIARTPLARSGIPD